MNDEITFEEWSRIWLENKKEFVKESTYSFYLIKTVNHLIPKIGNVKLVDIDEQLVQNLVLDFYYNGKIDKSGGLSERSVKDLVMIIKLIMKAAARRKLVQPPLWTIDFPKSKKIDEVEVLSKDEAQRLVQEIYLNLTPKNLGILLCLQTGLRIGELCALQWGDIDFENRKITVNKTLQRIFIKNENGKSDTKISITLPKTRSSIREIPISSSLFPVLNKMKCENPHTFVITGLEKPVEPRTIRTHFTTVLKKNNIKHIKFHGLRHTFATRCIEAGADSKTVSQILGHSTVTMTLNLYVHPQLEQKRKAIEMVSIF